MKGNRADRGKRSFIERDGLGRNLRNQQTWHAIEFRVYRISGARTCDSVPDTNICNSLTDSNYGAGAAITQCARLIEPAAHSTECRQNTITADFVENFLHQVGASFRFLKKILAGKLR